MEKCEYSSGAPQMMESTQTKTYPKRRHKYAAFLCALFVFMVCSGFSFDLRLPSDPLKLASAYGDTQATHPVFYILMSLGMVILFGSRTHLIRKPMTVRKIPISLPAMMASTGYCRVDSVIRWMIRLKTINSTFAIIVIRNWFIIATQMNWNAGGDMLTTVKIR